jgi:hypothetical protein
MATPRDIVKAEGFALAVGSTKNIDCVFCEGGDHHDRDTLSVTRDSNGLVLYICHRAKCGVRGRILTLGGGYSTATTGQKKFIPNPYKGMVREFTIEELSLMSDLWRVDLEDVHHAGWGVAAQEGEYLPLIMPVISPAGVCRGHVLRVQNPNGTKTVRSFKILDEPWIAWYFNSSPEVVVVEDQISALRASEFCNAVALLGAEMSQEKFEEIVGLSGARRVWFALDKDALRKGMELLKRYRLYFPNINLLILPKDIKNMSTTEMLSLGGPFTA